MAVKKETDYGAMLVASYFVLFLVNAIIIYFANKFFPQHVVLGVCSLPLFWAIIHSMGTLAMLNAFIIPFIRKYEDKRGKMFSNKEWMLLYFVLNTVGIWILARFAERFGMGISSWRVAVVLGIVLDIAQGVAMVFLEKYRVSK